MASWFKQLFSKAKISNSTVLGVFIAPRHAAWCLLAPDASGMKVVRAESVDGDFQSPAAALQALAEQAPLPAERCVINLSHQYYNLLLVESPDVPDDELREAVKWKIKDLINQPVESLVVDAFSLPDDAYRGRLNYLYVAAIEKALMQALITACETLNIDLQEVGINEVALARLANTLITHEDRGAAFLYLDDDTGTINLIDKGYLYLTRTIELGGGGVYSGNLNAMSDPTDALALDVQRSLDYYESQLGKSGVTDLYVVSHSAEHLGWCEELQKKLPIRVSIFSLADTTGIELQAQDQMMGSIAPALAAALGGSHGIA